MLKRQSKSDAKENTLEIQFKILHTAIYEQHYTRVTLLNNPLNSPSESKKMTFNIRFK